jgi:hypothetical protein
LILVAVVTLLLQSPSPALGLTIVQSIRRVDASWNGAGRASTDISTQPGYWLGIVLSTVSPITQTNQESEISADGVSYSGRIHCGYLCEAQSTLTLDFQVDDPGQYWTLLYDFSASSPDVSHGYVQLQNTDTGEVLVHVSPVAALGSGELRSSLPLTISTNYRLQILQLTARELDEWSEWQVTFAVPEPGTALLLGLGLIGLATGRRD